MVVRELERDAAALAAKKQNDAGMLRVLDCFDQGVCFVDTSAAKWQGMHCNSALAEVRFWATFRASCLVCRLSRLTGCSITRQTPNLLLTPPVFAVQTYGAIVVMHAWLLVADDAG